MTDRNFTPEELAKLPKWARDKAESLEYIIRDLRADIASVSTGDGSIVIRSHSTHHEDVAITAHHGIEFKLKDGTVFSVMEEYDKTSKASMPSLRIRNQSGGLIGVYATASNNIEVYGIDN